MNKAGAEEENCLYLGCSNDKGQSDGGGRIQGNEEQESSCQRHVRGP